jgi:hypothetical protein
MRIKPFEITVALVLILCAFTSIANGKVYQRKDAALKKALSGAETIETVNLYLTEPEMDRIAKASGVRPDSALYSFYAGKKGTQVTGYAAIEAATVRTLPETAIVTLEPDGSVRSVEILAFFEPEEYKPSDRWLAQFPSKRLSTELRVGGEIQGITGATLSAQAITRQVRKSAALLELYLEKNR